MPRTKTENPPPSKSPREPREDGPLRRAIAAALEPAIVARVLNFTRVVRREAVESAEGVDVAAQTPRVRGAAQGEEWDGCGLEMDGREGIEKARCRVKVDALAAARTEAAILRNRRRD